MLRHTRGLQVKALLRGQYRQVLKRCAALEKMHAARVAERPGSSAGALAAGADAASAAAMPLAAAVKWTFGVGTSPDVICAALQLDPATASARDVVRRWVAWQAALRGPAAAPTRSVGCFMAALRQIGDPRWNEVPDRVSNRDENATPESLEELCLIRPTVTLPTDGAHAEHVFRADLLATQADPPDEWWQLASLRFSFTDATNAPQPPPPRISNASNVFSYPTEAIPNVNHSAASGPLQLVNDMLRMEAAHHAATPEAREAAMKDSALTPRALVEMLPRSTTATAANGDVVARMTMAPLAQAQRQRSATDAPQDFIEYTITLENRSHEADYVAISRHWWCVDADDDSVRDIVGLALVGETPTLKRRPTDESIKSPESRFEYTSRMPLPPGHRGYMRGALLIVPRAYLARDAIVPGDHDDLRDVVKKPLRPAVLEVQLGAVGIY